MIYDDLPTNMDYLDESFGAAAGLRELRDDDLDEFDVEGPNVGCPGDILNGVGVVSKVGGETIKMLRPEGIKVIENYFRTVPPQNTDKEYVIKSLSFPSLIFKHFCIVMGKLHFNYALRIPTSLYFCMMDTIG